LLPHDGRRRIWYKLSADFSMREAFPGRDQPLYRFKPFQTFAP
jgi:hypothetical protein